MNKKIDVQGIEITTKEIDKVMYVSLTDIARLKNSEDPSDVIKKWMTNKESFKFYSLWEELFNNSFNSAESRRIKIEEVGYNFFIMTPTKWHKLTNAIGIIPSTGKHSQGTFAHPDIAFEFASWISAEFKLYLIAEFQRLKSNENKSLEWSVKRELTKINYHIHTNAVKKYIIPVLNEIQVNNVYSSEADLLNAALFGMTARTWKEKNTSKQGNIRDYASLEELIILANLESINSILIKEGLDQKTRLIKLNEIARSQMQILVQRLKKSTDKIQIGHNDTKK